MIIGIGHKKQSGKDTVAVYIRSYLEQQGYPCVIDSFAEGLKQVLLQLFPKQLQRRHLYGTDADKLEPIKDIKIVNVQNVCGRTLMQFFGTEVCRAMYDKIWCMQLANRAAQQPGKATITSDVRFPNEVETIIDHKGIVIKVSRPGFVSTDSHESENALNAFNDWTWEVVNDSNLEDLQKKSIDLCETIIIPKLKAEVGNIRRF